MKTINSIDQLKRIGGRIYVRWSQSIALDNRRGYSLRSGTQAEAGLSCCEIDPSWEDWRILRQLQEYSFAGGHCWIITGRQAGTGGDNEPLLRDVRCLAKVGPKLLRTNWRRMQLEHEIADGEARLSRITDRFGREIVSQSIARNKQLLERIK